MTSLRLAAAALATIVLSSCTVVVEDGPRPLPPPGPGPGPQFCTRHYAPVCGRDGPDRQTFGNACMARAAGYRILYPGQCRREGPPMGPPPQQFCTREYAPVCGRRGGIVRTFGNQCEADVAGFRIIADGPC